MWIFANPVPGLIIIMNYILLLYLVQGPRATVWLKHKMPLPPTESKYIFWIFKDLLNSINSTCRFSYSLAHVWNDRQPWSAIVIVNGCWRLRFFFFFLSLSQKKSENIHPPRSLYIESKEYFRMQKQVNIIWKAWLNFSSSVDRNWPVTKCKNNSEFTILQSILLHVKTS